MAAPFLSTGRVCSLKRWDLLVKAPTAALCTKPRDMGKPAKKTAQVDPIQKLFIEKIHEYSSKSKLAGGLVDVSPEYERNLAEEVNRLHRLFGGGDLTKFPDIKFPEPKLEEVSSK